MIRYKYNLISFLDFAGKIYIVGAFGYCLKLISLLDKAAVANVDLGYKLIALLNKTAMSDIDLGFLLIAFLDFA